MRNTTRVSVLFTVLWTLFPGMGSIARAQYFPNCACPDKRTISASGTAEVTADADLAIVRVGYKLYGADAKSAYASALDTSNAVMQALTSSGIPKSAIESTSQVIQRTQLYDLQMLPGNSPERERRQFTVSQSWTIRVKPDEASGVLNTAINAGANESGWIQWIVNDPSALEAQASAKAIANSRAIAEQIAQKAAVHLGNLISVTQNQNVRPYMGPVNGFGGGYGMGDSVMLSGALQPTGQQLAINSRRVEFTVTVYAVFAIE